MSVLVLLLLLGVAGTIQYRLDSGCIRALARERGWAVLGIAWVPTLLRSRWERSYRLSYRAEDGRLERRVCRLVNPFDGAGGVALEPAVGADELRGARALSPERLGRPVFVLLCAVAGLFAGCGFGIAACFALYPGSNIAPAYGVILGAPLGALGGAVLGLLLGRRH